jgi:putative heme-binding domain-containing protein
MKVFIVLLVLCPLAAQHTGNALEDGRFLYRSNCAFCHGLNGGGGRGPSLTRGRLQRGSAVEDIRRVIREGVPGTNMPAFQMEKEELDNLAAFVRALSGSDAKGQPVPGDAARGREVYARNGCAACHRIGNDGSLFGPELTRVGGARSTEYLRESIVNPSADIPEDFEAVTVVQRDGRRSSGIRVNEDTFTVQLRDQSQRFRMFQKDEVREVIHEKKSLMPAYASMPKHDLQNLLAYLDALRGEIKGGANVPKTEAIR